MILNSVGRVRGWWEIEGVMQGDAFMGAELRSYLKKLSFSATTVKPVACVRSRPLLETRLPVLSRYSNLQSRDK